MNFLTLNDLNKTQILFLLDLASEFKKGKTSSSMKGKVLGLIFEKESTRTRISFEVASHRLGGTSIYLGSGASQISRGETYADTARVISRYLDFLVLRTSTHQHLEEMASHATIPIINGLSDDYHPCQLLADLLTLKEKNHLSSQIAYVGDGNNMANTWIQAAILLDLKLNIICPKGYGPLKSLIPEARKSGIQFFEHPKKGVAGCSVINTDTWFSMGQKVSRTKKTAFKPFQVNEVLLSAANSDAIVLHCLPAHRGEEITDSVMDGEHSVVFDQAENRLYVQMALLEFLSEEK